MKWFVTSLALLLAIPVASAQTKPEPLSLGDLHHPIATSNREAQQMFDEGLTLIYGFNHEEALRKFQRAAELDPKSPMPLWGVAMAVGPNYNLDVDLEREKQAYDAIQKALQLAAAAPESERAYVEALAKRFTNDPHANLKQFAANYSVAMREVARRYTDDPDAGVLFAESMMDLNPWHLWSNDGKPAPGTEEIVATLERVLRRSPDHVGANHFYIHAMEASPFPERALPSAKRLETMVPAAGHLVHMPSHIYENVGDFHLAVISNEQAVAADQAFLATAPPGGMYGAMYFGHNLHFLAYAAMMEGNYAKAKDATANLDAAVRPALAAVSMVESFLPWSTFVEMRFARWEEIKKLPAPDAKLVMSTCVWHFAQGSAFAAMHQLERARDERSKLEEARKSVPAGPAYGMLYNDASVLLDLASNSLDARIADAAGDRTAAIASWRKAVAIQDAMSYDDPPEWYYPVRESLGAALLADGQAAEAEKTFREDLDRNPRNPRSLFGLWQSLLAQKREVDATWVHRQFLEAWQYANVELRLQDF
jgi:tetratricopeptide (TPR) repeat protein